MLDSAYPVNCVLPHENNKVLAACGPSIFLISAVKMAIIVSITITCLVTCGCSLTTPLRQPTIVLFWTKMPSMGASMRHQVFEETF